MRNQLIGLSIFFAAMSFSSPAFALDDNNQYEIIKLDGEYYVFDKQTGETTPLRDFKAKKAEKAKQRENLPILKNDPPVKSPQDIKVLEPRKTSEIQTPVKLPPKQIEIDTNDDSGESVMLNPGTKKIQQPTKPEPLPAKPDTSGVVTDEMRKACFTTVSSYRSNLSLIQTVQIQGGRIKGTIAVTNKGKKKLDLLELTLFVPKGDGLTFEEHHFMFGYKPGLKPPPAPNVEDPDSADPQIMIVDFPAPPGGGRSKVDIKVTYLKFTEE